MGLYSPNRPVCQSRGLPLTLAEESLHGGVVVSYLEHRHFRLTFEVKKQVGVYIAESRIQR